PAHSLLSLSAPAYISDHEISGLLHDAYSLIGLAVGRRSCRDARLGAGPARAGLGCGTEVVLRGDRAAGAAGGRERLCRQDGAKPQSTHGRSDLPPLLRRARPAAGTDAALAGIGRNGRS